MDYTIPVQTRTIHKVSWSDLERLVNDTYGFGGEWDFVANEECGNDSDHSFSTERKLMSFQEESLAKFVAGDPWALQFDTNTIITDLANRGLIPHGEYLVGVSW